MSDTRTLVDISEALDYAVAYAEKVEPLKQDLLDRLLSDWKAGDLIPRAEHDAAMAEAVKEALVIDGEGDVARAAKTIVAHEAKHGTFNPWLTNYNGQQYRVTVERMDVGIDIAHGTDKAVMGRFRMDGASWIYEGNVEPADAEPVGWANRYGLSWTPPYVTEKNAIAIAEGSTWGNPTEIAVPLYRHPAPQPSGNSGELAVAPVGVVEEILEALRDVEMPFLAYAKLRTALARITESEGGK